ncbi:MAG: hypothetical protein WED33_03705 [Bacteroidia bacterium]
MKSQSDSTFYRYDAVRINHQLNGMKVLGTWSLINITSGLILRNNTMGEDRYFHEMNAIWNTVNLGLAASGFIKVSKEQPENSAFAVLDKQLQLEKTLLLNSGLDIAYITAGAYLLERSKNENNPIDRQRFRGYGRGLVLQGAFLLIFDSVFYAIESSASKDLRKTMSFIYLSPSGVGFSKTF